MANEVSQQMEVALLGGTAEKCGWKFLAVKWIHARFDQSIDRLLAWLIDCLLDWSIDWLIDWLIARSIDWLIDWFDSMDWFDWLIDWIKMFSCSCVVRWQLTVSHTEYTGGQCIVRCRGSTPSTIGAANQKVPLDDWNDDSTTTAGPDADTKSSHQICSLIPQSGSAIDGESDSGSIVR